MMCDWRVALIGGTTPEGDSENIWLVDTVTLDCAAHQTTVIPPMAGHSLTASGPFLILYGGCYPSPHATPSAIPKELPPQGTLCVPRSPPNLPRRRAIP